MAQRGGGCRVGSPGLNGPYEVLRAKQGETSLQVAGDGPQPSLIWSLDKRMGSAGPASR